MGLGGNPACYYFCSIGKLLKLFAFECGWHEFGDCRSDPPSIMVLFLFI